MDRTIQFLRTEISRREFKVEELRGEQQNLIARLDRVRASIAEETAELNDANESLDVLLAAAGTKG